MPRSAVTLRSAALRHGAPRRALPWCRGAPRSAIHGVDLSASLITIVCSIALFNCSNIGKVFTSVVSTIKVIIIVVFLS